MEESPVCYGLQTIASITPTICKAMNIKLPRKSLKEAISEINNFMKSNNIDEIEKCLIYAPDAIAYYLTIRYSSDFEIMNQIAPINSKLCSIYPPKTPVCFASMFTGAMPNIHGITEYKKPVLSCDTLFDALVRSKKKVAIVAVKDSSIDLIFRDRAIDYYSEKYDEEVTQRTLDLISNNKYDFILVYHQEYDDALHATTPISEKALQAMKNHIKSYQILTKAFNESYKKYNRLISFSPDHGAHINIEDGRGAHGNNIPEDMIIRHYFSIKKSD